MTTIHLQVKDTEGKFLLSLHFEYLHEKLAVDTVNEILPKMLESGTMETKFVSLKGLNVQGINFQQSPS
jgi:hypothetical protein